MHSATWRAGLALALAAAPLVAKDRAAPLAATNVSPPNDPAAMTARIAAFPAARGVETPDAYTPAETVRGGGGKAISVATPADAGISDAALAAAKAYAEAKGSFALLIARDGKLVSETYWQGYTPASRFSTASMHKSVMALSFGAAVAAGRIALADPVGKYLPEWAEDPRGNITLGQLLGMASGLGTAPAARPGDPASAVTQLMFGDDLRAAALRFDAQQPPGQEFAYANVNSQLAGMALTRAVGGRYADWLSKTVWKPIGASDAALWLDRPGGTPHLFCCLQATPRDWLRIGELIRLRGKVGARQVVSAAWIDGMTAPSALNPNFGLHLWRGSPYAPVRRYAKAVALTVAASAPMLRDDVYYIDGAAAQRVYVIPSAGLTIVRIGKPAIDWDEAALPNAVLAGLPR